MKHAFLLGMAAALVGMAGALVAYDRFIVAPRQHEASLRVEVDLEKARREARAIADEAQASVGRSVADARRAMEDEAMEMEMRRLAQEAMARTSMYKSALAEYHASNGNWPSSASAAGLPLPEEAAGGAVGAIHIGRGGTLRLEMAPPFAAGSTLVLSPEASDTGMPTTWSCLAHGDDALRRHLPQCR